MAAEMRVTVSQLLKGIDRYNPENLKVLEHYVHLQVNQLKVKTLICLIYFFSRYQFNPAYSQTSVISQILLKALMNLPNADFIMCRCVIDDAIQQDLTIKKVILLAERLETCAFTSAWQFIKEEASLVDGVTGFHDAIRNYITYVIGVTYQTIEESLASELLGGLQGAQLQDWIKAKGWMSSDDGTIYVTNQEAHIKSKNIAEKIDFASEFCNIC
ncbi:predicted protein [Nematostella vectensis]|uniref:Eukaryotic translation initiation factor 3 subunit K n=1 Tax=Nematostella vectensis TaxID=45351 RepID=A7T899_NEMVE|nr:predicted protein [Nematostella vectensis]|eukprot:XP_001619895.1 hypothetical protein NEMVEDRAFT_v1g149904 [Nematostella vectensis]